MDQIPLNQQPNHPSTAPESTLNAQPSASAASTSMLTSNPAVNLSTTQTYTSDIDSQTQPSAQRQMQAQSQSQPSEQASEIPTTVPPGPGSDPAAAAAEYPHQIHGVGGPTATAPFLQDFSLVAEAAKRAQMAVVMRDMEGISL